MKLAVLSQSLFFARVVAHIGECMTRPQRRLALWRGRHGRCPD